MLELERGIVTFYDPSKMVGRVVVLNDEGAKTSEELLFHLCDAEFLDAIEGESYWIGKVYGPHYASVYYKIRDVRAARRPKPGSIISFSRDANNQANPWTDLTWYNKEEEPK